MITQDQLQEMLEFDNELYIKSCKQWREKNPNGKHYRFDIINHGSRFDKIREMTLQDDEVYNKW